jgi:hypothetical protein
MIMPFPEGYRAIFPVHEVIVLDCALVSVESCHCSPSAVLFRMTHSHQTDETSADFAPARPLPSSKSFRSPIEKGAVSACFQCHPDSLHRQLDTTEQAKQ